MTNPASEAGRRLARRRWGTVGRRAGRGAAAHGERGPPRSLRAVREAYPLSQWELAEWTGLSESTIQGLEKGGRRPHPKTARELARVLKVEVGDIAWG